MSCRSSNTPLSEDVKFGAVHSELERAAQEVDHALSDALCHPKNRHMGMFCVRCCAKVPLIARAGLVVRGSNLCDPPPSQCSTSRRKWSALCKMTPPPRTSSCMT